MSTKQLSQQRQTKQKQEAVTTSPKNQIITGYKMSGRTWISDKWNKGTLIKEDIFYAIDDEFCEYTEDELRSHLLESEAEYAKEMFENEGNTMSYKECLAECVKSELRRRMDTQDCQAILKEALQELYEKWTDDPDDEGHFERVCCAHDALDTYCRKLQYGEFGW